MGYCSYNYNASEVYQRTKPGMGVETSCGALTYPAVDEPELVPMLHPNGDLELRRTGRHLPREQDDPYCPAHGGVEEPDVLPPSLAELEQARRVYSELAQRFSSTGGVAPVAAPEPAQLPAPVPFDVVAAQADTSALTGGTSGQQ